VQKVEKVVKIVKQ